MLRYSVTIALACGLVVSCGKPNASPASRPDGFYISISNFSFSPVNLQVPPGATITVINDDAAPHSVTSESVAESYTPGSVNGISFDTGSFTGDKSFTLPMSAQDGTVIPYYCSVHKGSMTTKTGSITIDASAQPGPPPGSGG